MKITKFTSTLTTLIFAAVLLTNAAFGQAPAAVNGKTALDKYLETPDPSYRYELVTKIPGQGFTTYIIDMTSQTWRSTNEVNRNVWKHWMILVKPDEVKTGKSLLYISGGNNNSAAPKGPDEQIARIAVTTKSVVTDSSFIIHRSSFRLIQSFPSEFQSSLSILLPGRA